jgi:anti-anti-sigma regulatory factor
VVIEFLNEEIASPLHARELGAQLDSLIRPDLPRDFVIDFGTVGSLGSTAFSEIVRFARKVDRLCVCNLHESLRIGAALSGLDDCAESFASRQEAIDRARTVAMGDEDDTVDYPASWGECDDTAHP